MSAATAQDGIDAEGRGLHLFPLLAAQAVVLWCASAGPDAFDTGELASAAFSLGASHQPGQPLHALLGHLAIWLPIGTIPLRLAMLSVLGEGLAAYLTGSITAALLAPSGISATHRRWIATAVALGALIAPPLLRQAGRVEVYGLALALCLGSIAAIFEWASSGPSAKQGGAASALLRAALLGGLAAAAHPPHAFICVLVGAAALLLRRRDLLRSPRILAATTGAFLLGLSVYIHLPLRAVAGAPMWGEPDTLRGFIDYVSGAAYRGNLHATNDSYLATIADVVPYLLVASGTLPALGWAMKIARAVSASSADRGLALVHVLAAPLAASAACMQPLEPGNPDNVAYTAPAICLLMAVGVASIATSIAETKLAPFAPIAAALVALNLPALRGLPEDLRMDAPVLETLAALVVDAPPPRSLAVLRTDFVAGTFMSARILEGARPDVAIFITGLATSSWHWRTLAPHPVFDGAPHRGRGADARGAYVDGAFRRAARRVPIVDETATLLEGRGVLLGIYLALPAAGGIVESTVLEASAAERGERVLLRELIAAYPRFGEVAAGLARHHMLDRSQRLIARDHLEGARRSLASVMRPEHARLLTSPRLRATLAAPVVSTILDPAAPLPTQADVDRAAACLLWSLDDKPAAEELLRASVIAGDARALLQLAWLEWSDGDLVDARATLELFRDLAPPEAAPEAASLESALATPPATP